MRTAVTMIHSVIALLCKFLYIKLEIRDKIMQVKFDTNTRKMQEKIFKQNPTNKNGG